MVTSGARGERDTLLRLVAARLGRSGKRARLAAWPGVAASTNV